MNNWKLVNMTIHWLIFLNMKMKAVKYETFNQACWIAGLVHPRVYAPYPSSIRAFRAFTLINRCPVLLQLKSKIYFVRALQLTIQLWSLSSLLFYHIKLCYILFFFHFKPFIRQLFIQLFCNNIFTFSVLFFFFETNLTNIQYSYI